MSTYSIPHTDSLIYDYIISIVSSNVVARNVSTNSIISINTDFSVVFNAVVSAIPDGGTIAIKAGTYTPTTIMTVSKSINIIGIGEVVFNGISTSNANLFLFAGTSILSTTLTSDVATLTDTIVATSITGIQVGDLVYLKDDTIFNSTYYPTIKTSEVHKVYSISGNTITTEDNIVYNYTISNNATVIVYRPIKVVLDNIKIIGTSITGSYFGIELRYVSDSIVRNCNISKNGYYELLIADSYKVTIDKCKFGDNWMVGQGYGVDISGSAYITICNSYFYNSRHCITQGGGTGNLSLTRETRIHDNEFAASVITTVGTSIDAHGMVVSQYIYNNTINCTSTHYAANAGARLNVYNNNQIIGGLGIYARDANLNNIIEINNCQFTDVYNYILQNTTITDYLKSISIINCSIKGKISNLIEAHNVTYCKIQGNQYVANDSVAGGALVYLDTIGILIISDNLISKAWYEAIWIKNVNDSNILNNTIKDYSNNYIIGAHSGQSSYAIRLENCLRTNVSENTLVRTGNDSSSGILETGTSDKNIIKNNNISQLMPISNTYRITVIGTSTIVKNNYGYITEQPPEDKLKIASANVRNSHDAEITTTSGISVKLKTITLGKGLLGNQRFLFDIKTSSSNSWGKVCRNGVMIGTEQTTTSSTYITISQDLTQNWQVGDTVELWVRSYNSVTASVQNFRIAYDDAPTVAVVSTNS